MVKSTVFAAFVLASALAHSTAADPSPTQQVDVTAGYKLSYADVDGTPLTAKEFDAKAKNHSYGIMKNLKTHTAVLRLNSQADIDKQKAALAHPKPSPLVGKAFPVFDAPSVDGKTRRLADYRGKTVLVNFFFATCLPCIQEIPALNAFKKAHPEIEVLGITFDDRKTASEFVARRAFAWPIIYDGQSLADQSMVSTYPTMVLIGPDGVVRKAAISSVIGQPGGQLTPDRLAAWVGATR